MNLDNQQNPERSYGTGSTHPAKNRSSMLAVVLAAVVLLGGVFSLMSALNIRLSRKLNETEPAVVFSRASPELASAGHIGDQTPMLGIRCETVSPFMQRYYHLPNGVYVTQVLDRGAAQSAGLQPGDVINAMDGDPVFTAEALAGAVRSRQVGDRVWLTVARGESIHSVSLILKSEEP